MSKLKKNRGFILVTGLICLIPMFIGLALYQSLPEMMATHFNAAGEVDGYSSKNFTVFAVPLFLLVIHLLIAILIAFDEKKGISDKMYHLALCIIPFTTVFVTALTYSSIFNIHLNVSAVTFLFVGILFFVLDITYLRWVRTILLVFVYPKRWKAERTGMQLICL